MKKTFQKYILLLLFILGSNSLLKSQSFGFGCLGLSGFYGGFTQQAYVADGINEFVQQNYSSPNQKPGITFKEGTGFRIGANLFRAKMDYAFITLKGFYQFMKEEHQIIDDVQSGILKNNYQLSMNYWGVGLDFGIPLFSIVDWKIVEGGITFYNSELSYRILLNDEEQSELKLSPETTKLGYYVGSGIILHLVRDYISIEGTAAYSILRIDNMNNDNGDSLLPESSTKKAMGKGGFTATVQLNIGFPL